MRSKSWDIDYRNLATILVIAALTTGSAAAQDHPPPPEPEESADDIAAGRRAVIEHAGRMGVWFRLDVAKELLDDVADLPLFVSRVELLEDRASAQDEIVRLHAQRAELLEQARREADELYVVALARARDASLRAAEAEAALSVWHRSRVLWLSVGVAAAVLATSAGALAF